MGVEVTNIIGIDNVSTDIIKKGCIICFFIDKVSYSINIRGKIKDLEESVTITKLRHSGNAKFVIHR